MKKWMFILLYFLSSQLFGQITLHGKINGLNKAGVSTLYLNALGLQDTIDSIAVVNDQFNIEIKQPGVKIYQVIAKDKALGFSFWSDGITLSIEGGMQDIIVTNENKHFHRYVTNLKKSGSHIQQENDSFFKGIKAQLDSLDNWAKTKKLNIALVGEVSDIDKITIAIADKVRTYILEHPNSELSAFLLFIYGTYEPTILGTESKYLQTRLKSGAKSYYEDIMASW